MSRYTGPRRQAICMMGIELAGFARPTLGNRLFFSEKYGSRTKPNSNFDAQLTEKQKLSFNCNRREQQGQSLILKADRNKGLTNNKFSGLIKRRSDNIIFPAAFASNIASKQQLLSQFHTPANGRCTNTFSFQVDNFIGSVSARLKVVKWWHLN